MTEREKMINGELYDSADKELEQLRLRMHVNYQENII